MRILLIRHAEPDYSVDSLTPKGRVEAELLSRRLIKYNIRDFYVSPLGRAKDTAAYTLDKLHRSAEELPWLAEFRARVADPVTGRYHIPWDLPPQRQMCIRDRYHIPWDLPPRFWPDLPGSSDVRSWADAPFFAGSDVKAIWQETMDGADALLARYGFRKDGPVWRCAENSRDTICLFCHFGISMAFLAYLTDCSPLVLWHHTLTLPSSLTEVVTEERTRGEVSFRITRLGDIAHLETAGEKRSTAGLFPECFTGIDSTDPAVNGTSGTEPVC